MERVIRRLSALAMSLAMLCSLFPASALAAGTAPERGENGAFLAEDAAVFQSGKSYGGQSTDAFNDVLYTSDGGFLVKGYSFGESADPAWTHTGSGNNNDAILLKFDGDYQLEWSRAYGGEGIDLFEGVAELADGRIAAIGRQTFTASAAGEEVMKNVSCYLLLIDPKNPDNYDEYHIGGTSGDYGYGIAAAKDGGFVAAVQSASKSGYITRVTAGTAYTEPVQLWEPQDGTDDAIPNRVAPSGSDSVVIKFDKDGNVEYTALHNYVVSHDFYTISTPTEKLSGLALDSAGDIFLSGSVNIAKSVTNGFVAKLSGADGSVLWDRTVGRNSKEAPADKSENIIVSFRALDVLKDGSVVVSGTTSNDITTDEALTVTGARDVLVLRYDGKTGSVLFADAFGRLDDSDSRPEGVAAMPDGGYLVCTPQSGAMTEKSQTSKGYQWGNYGGEDAVLIRYGADNKVLWAQNYGTKNGDWLNAVAVREDGEIIAVGESNGKYGTPAWGNHGGIDGVIVCTNLYDSLYTQPLTAAEDGDVVWADGTYTASGDGFGGDNSVEVTVVIQDGSIASVTGESHGDSAAYYEPATALHKTIVDQQTANVDGVSGATYSSNGIKEAASRALGQAAAASVDALIAAIDGAEDKKAATQSAADAYAELGTYSVGQLKNLETLQAAAEANGITLVSRADKAQPETNPGAGETTELRYNDPYYQNQYTYYQNIHTEAFADAGLTGKGVTIAVIDSGLTPSHSDLDYSRVLPGYDYDSGKGMGTDGNPYVDNNGHGTAVAGILAAVADNGIGVAGLLSEVSIVPLKVTPVAPGKDGDETSSAQVAQAIRDAVDKYGADVITTSLDVKDTTALKEAVAYAASQNVIITGAAGNSSTSESDPYVYPASYDEVVSVGAVDAKNAVRASSQKNDKVFVTAPGEGIVVLDLSLSGRCKVANGTSYASPIVAAMAAAAKQYDKDMTAERFQELLKASSVDAGAEGYDTSYGWGIVDFAAFANVLQGKSASGAAYVLMNIPYGEFYAAELNDGAAAVDAVTSATKNKPRTGGLAGGSYHVNSDGTDITGVIYPVQVADLSVLAGKKQVTDDDAVSITVSNRGTETTTEYKGQEALFESDSYSYYVLSEPPAYYKELTVGEDGAFSFGPVVGEAETVSGVTGTVTVGGRHTDVEIALTIPENGGVKQGDAVSGVILTDSDGATYGLRHIVNIWRGTELGWNLGELDLNGKTISNVRYITQSGVYDYPVTLAVSNPGYVLMNIPYAEFYAAELDGGAVDAVTTATLKFENAGIAAGSYHEKDVDTDADSGIAGVTYPVFVPDLTALDAKLEIKAADKKTINLVTGREKAVTATEVEGADILFCAPSYSWLALTENPARYKTLTVGDGGAFTFGAVSGRASTVNDVTAQINYETHHGNDAEVVLTGTGIESDAVVGGVVLTDNDGAKYGLTHVQGIWQRTQLGWPSTKDIAGKTFTNVRFILRDSVIDCPVEFTVKQKLDADITAAFTGAREITISGLSDKMENVKVTVTYTTGTRPDTVTHTVADSAAVTDGKVAISEDAIDAQAYTVKVVCDNYGDKSVSVTYAASEPAEPSNPTDPAAPAEPSNPTEPSTPAEPANPSTPAKQGCYVATAVYGSYDCPEVWTLRRFRDKVLAKTWYGRLFIKLYYAVSPTAVKLFGSCVWFQNFFRARLDTMVGNLQDSGFESTPYQDRAW